MELDDFPSVSKEKIFKWTGGGRVVPGIGYWHPITSDKWVKEDIDVILEEAAKFCENTLLPINQSGDTEGCFFEGGKIKILTTCLPSFFFIFLDPCQSISKRTSFPLLLIFLTFIKDVP